MSKKAVPDAWDDDWEHVADKPEPTTHHPAPAPKLSKSERRAQHQQQQKELWDSAENPGRFHFLETQGVVPLKDEIKPHVTLLSRKPTAPVLAARRAAATSTNGVADPGIDEDDEDSEEEGRKKRAADSQERQGRAKREREEKQRKYDEARARIMGTGVPNTTASAPGSRDSSQGRKARPRTSIRAANVDTYSAAETNASPARPAGAEKTLYDPNDLGRRTMFRQEALVMPKAEMPVRAARGVDGSGR